MKTVIWLGFMVSTWEIVSAAQCKEISFTSDQCRNSSEITIASQKISKPSEDVRIKLTSPNVEVTWLCGSSRERLAWGEEANQIRANFRKDGTVQWTIYNCDDLSGPERAGIKCSDEAFSTACPGGTNDTCVFEVSRSTSFIDNTTTTVQVTGEFAHEVAGSTTAKISGSITHEVSKATVVEFQEKSYIIIPSGYRFCSYSDAISIRDENAPTGYKYQCSLTKFVQTHLSYSGPCSNHPKCSTHVCIASPSSATKVTFSFLFMFIPHAAIKIFAY